MADPTDESGAGPLLKNRYRLGRVLGRGGMCIVYQAWDTRLQRNVAVKRLEPPLNEDPRTRARFDREGRALAQLSHPNVVTLIDRGSTENDDYLVFEYVEGRSLKELIKEKPLDVAEVGPHRWGRWPRGWRPLTRPASSTATSSRRTSSSTGRATPRSPTSASPRGPTGPGSPGPARSSAAPATCRPSRSEASRWTPARTSTRSAWSCTRCWPVTPRSTAPTCPRSPASISTRRRRRSARSAPTCRPGWRRWSCAAWRSSPRTASSPWTSCSAPWSASASTPCRARRWAASSGAAPTTTARCAHSPGGASYDSGARSTATTPATCPRGNATGSGSAPARRGPSGAG